MLVSIQHPNVCCAGVNLLLILLISFSVAAVRPYPVNINIVFSNIYIKQDLISKVIPKLTFGERN